MGERILPKLRSEPNLRLPKENLQFEQLVSLVYRKQGYVVRRRGGANPDGGIDLVIEKDEMRTAVQCKHWKTWNVGVKAVREFLGALTDSGIQRGVFVTLGGYTGEAKQLPQLAGPGSTALRRTSPSQPGFLMRPKSNSPFAPQPPTPSGIFGRNCS